MVSGCDRELSAHFYSATSPKYHAPDTWHGTTPSHIILSLGRPVLALPSKSEEQLVPFLTTLVCRGPGSNPWPPVPGSGHSTNWAIRAGSIRCDNAQRVSVSGQMWLSAHTVHVSGQMWLNAPRVTVSGQMLLIAHRVTVSSQITVTVSGRMWLNAHRVSVSGQMWLNAHRITVTSQMWLSAHKVTVSGQMWLSAHSVESDVT